MTLAFIQHQICMEKQEHFLANFSIRLDEIWYAVMTLMLNFVCMIQGRELNFGDSKKNFVLRLPGIWDTYELISFKLGVMIDMTKLYILIPVLMIFTFTQES